MHADRFAMVDSFINKQKRKENGYNTTQCLKMFGVSDSGYYAWKGRREDKDGKCAQKKAERDGIRYLMQFYFMEEEPSDAFIRQLGVSRYTGE